MAFGDPESACIVVEYFRTDSFISANRWDNENMGKIPPTRNIILCWHPQFLENGKKSHREGIGRSRILNGETQGMRSLFKKSWCKPHKS